jgi:hypothetical protein
MNDTLELLKNNDKWFLGSGEVIWAPPFPQYTDKPGFWDEAHFYNFELKPVFTVAFIDDYEEEILPVIVDSSWNPAFLKQKYMAGNNNTGIEIYEEKTVLEGNTLISTFKIENYSKRNLKLNIIAWTVQKSYPSKNDTFITDIKFNNELSFIRNINTVPYYNDVKLKEPLRLKFEMGCSQKIKSYAVNIAQTGVIQPVFKYTPFYESFNKKLPDEIKVHGVNDDGLIYFGIHSVISLKNNEDKSISFYTRITDESKAKEVKRTIGKGIRIPGNPVEESVYEWNRYISQIPHFECSDVYLTKYYWYRWYGLRLLTLPPKGNIKYPAVAEGIEYFRAPITYSAQCHIMETKWMHDPAIAKGSILNWISNQLEDGSFPGYLDFGILRKEMFYHANWGGVLNEFINIHHDIPFLEKVYNSLSKYADYFDRERDREKSGLYDIINHYETGQEYMNRYMAVNPEADKQNWGDVFRLKGVEVTVYIYELKKFLAKTAKMLGLKADIQKWERESEYIKSSILKNMWDENTKMFFDLNCKNMQKTNAKAATCFYPFFTDIIDKKYIPSIYEHLLNKNEFWTKYPVPASSKDDKYFNAFAEWKGKRHSCPWNGRVWPMTNSHIAEALAYSAINIDKKLAKYAVEFINKFIRMMYHDGNIEKPNCYEHYNPENGKACVYRGVDDYQHSWVADLIIKYVAGIQFDEEGIIINPLPFKLKYVNLTNLWIRNNMYSFKMIEGKYVFYKNDNLILDGEIGKPRKLMF